MSQSRIKVDPELFELRTLPGRPLRIALGSGLILLVLGVWWFLTRGTGAEDRIISPVILPSPMEVLDSAKSLFQERALVRSITATLQRVLLGFALAIAVGVPLGILAGSWRAIDAFFFPMGVFGRNIPIAALIPLSVLWFGTGEGQKSMFIFIATVPFVFGTAVQSVIDVPDRYVETARTLGASAWRRSGRCSCRSRCPRSSTACASCSASRSGTSCWPRSSTRNTAWAT